MSKQRNILLVHLYNVFALQTTVDHVSQGGGAGVEVDELSAVVTKPGAIPLEGVGRHRQVPHGAQNLHSLYKGTYRDGTVVVGAASGGGGGEEGYGLHRAPGEPLHAWHHCVVVLGPGGLEIRRSIAPSRCAFLGRRTWTHWLALCNRGSVRGRRGGGCTMKIFV